jgi:hypothetical protein
MEPVKIIPVLGVLALILCAGCAGQSGNAATPAPSPVVPVITTTPQTTVMTTAPTPPPTPTRDPRYLDALPLKSAFTFGNGTKWTSEASITRIWVNDTYRWYNPAELQYDTRIAPQGKTYLFVFIAMVNHGTDRAPLPPYGNIFVVSGNDLIPPYALHPLPKDTRDSVDSTPRIARIAEIEYSRKVYSSELVEDYGYSHGQKLAYINPGESNAVEGYIIYEVPASMKPESTFVTMSLPDQGKPVWVLG